MGILEVILNSKRGKLQLGSVLILLSLAFSSCVEESIEPSFEVQTINQQIEDRPVRIHYPIRGIEVDRVGEGVARVPLLGRVFRRIGEAFADVAVSASSGNKIRPEPMVLMFPELDDVDFDLIKYVTLEDVYLEGYIKGSDERASLEFIREVNVYITAGPSVDLEFLGKTGEGKSRDDFSSLFGDRESIRILSYARGKGGYECDGACFRFSIERSDWKRILAENRVFMIETEIIVRSVPKEDIVIDGGITMSIGVNLDF